jgi:hypothetical protein
MEATLSQRQDGSDGCPLINGKFYGGIGMRG